MFWRKGNYLELFRKAGKKKEFPAGHELDITRYSAVVLESGICSLGTVTPDGDERAFLYFKKGNIMGFIRHLLPESEFPESHIYKSRIRIRTMTDATLYILDRRALRQLLEEHPETYADITGALAQNMSNMLEHASLFTCENAPVRICAMLVEFSEYREGRWILPQCFTQNEMANFLSLHKITVAKVIKALRQEGFIDRSRRNIELLDKASLEMVVQRELSLRY